MQLTDKYIQQTGTVYLTGIQALARLPLDQIRRDRAANLNTAAFISGYEGSPLGGYDLALNRIRPLLAEHNIHFQPGVNEDLAATSIFGSQYFDLPGPGKFDGVVGIWYGKGPGVDRSVDALRHANLAGSPGNCAAILLAGDDHACKSSSIPHQSDFSLMSAGIPVLFPGSVTELLDFGLYAVAASRYTGAWIALKLLTTVCDGGATVELRPQAFHLPAGYEKRTDPRSSPPVSNAMEIETNHRRLAALLDFARLNPINRLSGARDGARYGVATAGKAYYDLMQAFDDLGVRPEALGLRIAKFGMTFPLDARFAAEFAAGLDTVLVLEEKRSFLELHLRDALYNLAERPQILGKTDAHGAPLVPVTYELDPDTIARILISQLPIPSRPRIDKLNQITNRARPLELHQRSPAYCPGCPHNRSTMLLDGQISGGGIGCHGIGILLKDAGRGYEWATQMGGEGAPWIGMSPFTQRCHIFQNIGDGTYFHSGALAIEAAVAANVNVTYRLLYNGHVAMTGGQDAAGALPVPQLTRKLEAEGVRKIVLLTEDTARYSDPGQLARIATVRDRADLPIVLRELEQTPGVTVLLYDQECAAEKRRARARGKYAEPVHRLVIHQEVCEGCGDCITESNCLALHPIDTPLGQKVQIHQASCNKDYTCALGDCPSFLTVQVRPGTGLRKPSLPRLPETEVPEPAAIARAGRAYRILAPGIGGTGVVTVNAILAAAALHDGLSVLTLDQTGLAQKGGAVVSHLILSEQPLVAANRINAGNADLLLAFDPITASQPDQLRTAHPDRTSAVVNTHLTPTAEMVRSRTVLPGPEQQLTEIARYTRPPAICADATRLAESLFGTHLAANLFLTGLAWQAGLIPITRRSIEDAIRLNAVDVERNLQVFLWGRKYYHDPGYVESFASPAEPKPTEDPIELRVRKLTAHQNESYAREYRAFVDRVRARRPELAEPVARSLYKLMAYKDEYEVARLLTDPAVESGIRAQWESPKRISYNLHPPILRRLGLKRKIRLGPSFRPVLRLLAALRFLRGTPLDPFGYTAHRRAERELISWYRALIEKLLDRDDLEPTAARELAELPEQIRGYERIKEQSIAKAKARSEALLKPHANETIIEPPINADERR